jgi:uncharacterized membrane protein
MNIYVIFAILSPLFYAMMYVMDKYIVSRKVKNDQSYLALTGITYLTYSIILAAFLDWRGISFKDILLPILVGIFIVIQARLYIHILHKEDISHFTGLEYTYPIIVAILSYIFLKERIHWIGYLGLGIIIIGALLLSLRLKKIKLKANIYILVGLIFIIAINEFVIKISTSNINPLNGVVITWIVYSSLLLPLLLFKKNRQGFIKQKNIILIEFGIDFVGYLALLTLFFAMSKLPATIVSAIAVSQILFVILLEKVVDKFLGKIVRDKLVLPKLIALSIIAIGVLILSFIV